MPTTCWAPGCSTGYSSQKDVTRHHFFKAPKDVARLELWRKAIPRVGLLLPTHNICELHFEERCILKTYTCIINGQKVETPRGKWELTKDAIPTLFPSLPKYLSSD
jgi:THAP domain